MIEKKTPGSGESIIRRNRTFFVGLFITIPLILIPFLLTYSLLTSDWLQHWCHLSITTVNSPGLSKGSQITVSGMAIGYVTDVDLDREGKITVKFKIKDQYRPLVRKDTRAMLQQKNLVVGDWEIALTGGTQTLPSVSEGDTLQCEYTLRIDKTIDQITSMVTTLQQILQQVLDGKGTVGRLIKEDTLVNLLQQIGRNTEAMTIEANSAIKKADKLVADLQTTSAGGKVMLDSIMGVIASVKASLDGVQLIVSDVKNASGQLPEMLQQVRTEVGQVDMLMNSLQKNWLIRSATGKPSDPMLGKDP